ncbi:uncharacterized protein LOC9630895 [Selaginella moellendorffii]|uniref:uncharacterized protein LOC9630895 n=1 Tax=Selaginella moellendorffii TaxID=88036 RepID=UPI000D1CEB56|nr:uncharacterized protein LOC9630895 [Selaginella moellendorffii]|eukprot:XP_024528509.1 uncharacterized protein LOC9630895 [Selaginella moellendorffii]
MTGRKNPFFQAQLRREVHQLKGGKVSQLGARLYTVFCQFSQALQAQIQKMSTVKELRELLSLTPHPEGGFFYESFRDDSVLEIHDNGEVKQTVIGPDLAAGQKLQYTVQPMVWFGAFPTKDLIDTTKCVKASPRDSDKNFSLVGCTVAPGFEFQDFVMGESEELKKLFPHLADVIEYLT